MVDNNTVVVKINYLAKDKIQKKNGHSKLVTEWNVQRIVLALTLPIFFILLLVYFYKGESSIFEFLEVPLVSNDKKLTEAVIELSTQAAGKNQSVTVSDLAVNINDEKPAVESIDLSQVKQIKKTVELVTEISTEIVEKESSEINIKPVVDISITNKVLDHSRISRALLTKGLHNKEPLGTINTPLTISKQRPVRVYYYTEIMNMKGESLFHQWLWNDQLVYKKEIKILGTRWRASTSKLMSFSRTGIWKARLVNKEALILNEIQLTVIQE